MRTLIATILIFITSTVFGQTIAQHLQDISVTVHAGSGSGSGVLITREVDIKGKKTKITLVLTAAHVVDGLRAVRETVDNKTGTTRKIVEFRPMFITKDLIEDGRKVGETKMEGRVIKYSDADNGEDIAVCMLYKKNFVDATTKFDLADKELDVGTKLFHVGSLLGQDGSNSMTTGIMSQIGRVLVLNNRPIIFNQTTVTAFPGSSGGGVFIAEGEKAGLYTGMLVRGSGETFNLIVPSSRIKDFCTKHELLWVIDDKVPVPSLDDINKINIEDTK